MSQHTLQDKPLHVALELCRALPASPLRRAITSGFDLIPIPSLAVAMGAATLSLYRRES